MKEKANNLVLFDKVRLVGPPATLSRPWHSLCALAGHVRQAPR